MKHPAYMVVGGGKDHCHQGIGTCLFAASDEGARENRITRLELTVEEINIPTWQRHPQNGDGIEGKARQHVCPWSLRG